MLKPKDSDYSKDAVEIVLTNSNQKALRIYCEPSCFYFELKKGADYKIVTRDKSYWIDFMENNEVTFGLNHSCGFKLYKFEIDNSDWVLEEDLSELD